MKFLFRAKTKTGELREGTVEALSPEVAASILQNNGLIPLSLDSTEKSGFSALRMFSRYWNGVSTKEKLVFFQQLSTLIEARVPITTSLNTIGDQSTNIFFRALLKELASDIDDGTPFSEALARHQDIFDPLTINMIKAGEVSGSLHKAVAFVAENIDKNYQLSAKIKGALYYPIFVLVVAFILGFLVVTFILPKITAIIKDMNVAVPWYTSLLIWLGDFMNQYWWAVLIALLLALGAFIYYVKSPAGKKEWEIILLKLPVVGTLARNVYVTRFSENFSSLLESGIPVVKSLQIVSDVIGNHVYRNLILKASEEVRTGGNISAVFLASPKEVPQIVAQMIRIGEETGTVSKVLESVAKFYTQEVNNMTRNLTTLIEPILIVFLGIGVAILVVGVLLPIYNIAGQL
jgi:type II secretory pathway component PulF